jgi:hypothetical protein
MEKYQIKYYYDCDFECNIKDIVIEMNVYGENAKSVYKNFIDKYSHTQVLSIIKCIEGNGTLYAEDIMFFFI